MPGMGAPAEPSADGRDAAASSSPPPTSDEVLAVLATVVDPELGADIVSLGMVPAITVSEAGAVDVTVKLTIGGCPMRAEIKREVETRVGVHPGVSAVHISWGEMTPEERTEVMTKARWNARQHAGDTQVPASTRVLAIASGKGGVGKSSVTVNLAVALARRGRTVGVLDADIWGFSVPRLLGIDARLEGARDEAGSRPLIVPNEVVVGDGLLKVVSTGFLVDEDTALMWRGLMLTKAVEQFLRDVRWGQLDDLLIDMPPGTGDVQMGLSRLLPRADMVIVTTPALNAQKVAQRAADMARRSFVRVVGVIENMSSFTCEHGVEHAPVRRRRRPGARRADRRPAARPHPARAGGVRRRRRRSPSHPRRRRQCRPRRRSSAIAAAPRRRGPTPTRGAGRHVRLLGPPPRRRRRRPRRRHPLTPVWPGV